MLTLYASFSVNFYPPIPSVPVHMCVCMHMVYVCIVAMCVYLCVCVFGGLHVSKGSPCVYVHAYIYVHVCRSKGRTAGISPVQYPHSFFETGSVKPRTRLARASRRNLSPFVSAVVFQTLSPEKKA